MKINPPVGKLLRAATAMAALVTAVEGLLLVAHRDGGRVVELSYPHFLDLAFTRVGLNAQSRFPGFVERYIDFEGWRSVAAFLATGFLTTFLLGLVLAGAAGVALLFLGRLGGDRGRKTGRVESAWRLAFLLLFLAPVLFRTLFGTVIANGFLTVTVVLGLLAGLWVVLLLTLRGSQPVTVLWRAVTRIGLALGVVMLLGWGLATGTATAPPPFSGPNILLVSIDSLRADHVHCYGYRRATSPSLDALAAGGVRFTQAVAPTSWTLPSHLTMLTGLPPSRHGVVTDDRRLARGTVTLARVLRRAGYRTAGFVSGPYLRAEYGFSQGFAHYDDYTEVKDTNEASHSEITSPGLFHLVRAWLSRWDRRGRRRPFFLFLHMWDVHYDYIPPPPYNRLFDPGYRGSIDPRHYETSPQIHAGMNPRDLAHIIALYDGEIRYTDHYLGKIFAVLERLGVFDETIIVVTADHGDEFFEHGHKGHKKTLYDDVLRVPLIVHYPPRVPRGRVVRRQVRLMDIGPTLLSLAGVKPEKPFGSFSRIAVDNARDLGPLLAGALPDFPRLPAFGDLFGTLASVRTPRWKLIVRLGGRPRGELYDLAADPGEHDNLAAAQPARVLELKARLDAFRRQGRGRRHSRPVRLDQKQMDRLRSLGYIQ